MFGRVCPDALRRILRQDLKGDEVLIVSNREPYLHVRRKDNVIEIQRPASGLVTALEPVMRACSGTWIAHGAGEWVFVAHQPAGDRMDDARAWLVDAAAGERFGGRVCAAEPGGWKG